MGTEMVVLKNINIEKINYYREIYFGRDNLYIEAKNNYELPVKYMISELIF